MAIPAARTRAARAGNAGDEVIFIMAMPQRDNTIEELKRLDALREYAVEHGETEEAERIRAQLRRLAETV